MDLKQNCLDRIFSDPSAPRRREILRLHGWSHASASGGGFLSSHRFLITKLKAGSCWIYHELSWIIMNYHELSWYIWIYLIYSYVLFIPLAPSAIFASCLWSGLQHLLERAEWSGGGYGLRLPVQPRERIGRPMCCRQSHETFWLCQWHHHSKVSHATVLNLKKECKVKTCEV